MGFWRGGFLLGHFGSALGITLTLPFVGNNAAWANSLYSV